MVVVTQQVHRFPGSYSLKLTMTLGCVSSGLQGGAQVYVFEAYIVPSSLVLPCSQSHACFWTVPPVVLILLCCSLWRREEVKKYT